MQGVVMGVPHFPYTTLFRSGQWPGPNNRLSSPRRDAQLRNSPKAPGAQLPSDRKSTRLNSSHEWISYAVFCLKKKITEYERVARVEHRGTTLCGQIERVLRQ